MSKESYVVACIRRLREYGEGIVLADQCISSLKDIVKSNAYTIIGMSQIGQKDRREMVSVLGLDSEQAQVINLLDVGQAIVRLGGRYPFPQLIEFPFIKPKNMSESELDRINAADQRVRDLLSKVKPASRCQEVEEILPSIPAYTSSTDLEPKTDQMFEKAKDVLIDIFNRFDVPSTVRAKDFGLSASAADKIFKYIEREQFVDVVKLSLTSGRGGISKFFVLTNPKGYEAISKTPLKKSGGTGATHFFLQRYLKKHLLQKGFSNLEIEKNIGGKRIDVFGIYEGLKVGVEICVSTVRSEYLNVRKDKGKCDFLIIAAPDKKTKDKLDQELFKEVDKSKDLTTCVVYELLTHPEKVIFKP